MKQNEYRTNKLEDQVIGFSVSHDADDLLRRGLGIEHVRELLLRLARPILRQGANIAYGGSWQERPDNFVFDLLRVVSAEQEDAEQRDRAAAEQPADSDSEGKPKIGKLYNHSAWPNYLEVTPRIEAQWISSCRIVRITQRDAGLTDEELVPDAEASLHPRAAFNSALTLSAMRRLMMQEMMLPIPISGVKAERIPPIAARIMLGGKNTQYSGFMPGLYEEALVTLRSSRPVPLFILGGFGGASEVLAKAMLAAPGSPRPDEFTLDWHLKKTPKLAKLLDESTKLQFRMPSGAARTKELLDELYWFIEQARLDLNGTLKTWLPDNDTTRELMTTRDVATAVRLVRDGLGSKNQLPKLPG